MNIFVTSECPKECAKNLDDKRVVKMVLETAQMLSTAINELGGSAPYKSTHANHPCNVWARTTKANWTWLYEHFVALGQEYTHRYQKIHKSSQIGDLLLSEAYLLPRGDITPFVNCAANKSLDLCFKHIEEVDLAYKLYLNERWETDKRTPTWHGVAK